MKTNKKIEKQHEDFSSYSPNLLDLSQKEVDIIEITKKESCWSGIKRIFKKTDLLNSRCGVDFLSAKKRWRIPRVIETKIVNQIVEMDLPKFVTKLLYSKNSKIHQELKKIGLNFEKHPILNKLKKMLLFFILCLVVLMPIQGIALAQKFKHKQDEIMSYGQAGYDYLKQAQASVVNGDFNEAQKSFYHAEQEFFMAEKEIGWWRVFIPVTRFVVKESSAYYLLKSAKIISKTGGELTGWVVDLKNDMSINQLNSQNLDFERILMRVSELADRRDELESQVLKIEKYLDKVDISVLDQAQIEKIKPVKKAALRFLDTLEILPDFLGQGSMRQYLVIFQNNNELRATGGFIGSIALISVENGRIINIEIPGGGPYDLRAGLKDYIRSPKPISQVRARWEIQDSNWWPDFPTSAEKVAWFYENSDQPTVDGVIAVNSDILPKLLKIFGPITLEKYKKTITEDTFYNVTQYQVEVDYDKAENKPKQFIADLFFVMLERLVDNFALKNNEQLEFVSDVLNEFNQALEEKDIQIYLRNEDLQKKIVDIGIAGEIKNVENDYLMIVNSNINGGKTDSVIAQKVILKSKVQPDNTISNTLKITRTHNGESGDFLADIKNKNYMRIYVPKGAIITSSLGFSENRKEVSKISEKVLKADDYLFDTEQNEYFVDGMRVYEESDKTVFANWLDLELGQTRTIVINYELPFKYEAGHDIYIQRQAGSKNSRISTEFVFLSGKKIKNTEDLDKDILITTVDKMYK